MITSPNHNLFSSGIRPEQSQGAVELLQEDEPAAEVTAGRNQLPQIIVVESFKNTGCNLYKHLLHTTQQNKSAAEVAIGRNQFSQIILKVT